MAERSPDKPSTIASVFRNIIYALLLGAFICGGMVLCFYLSFKWEYIRGDFAAFLAQGRVEQIYGQLRSITPDGVSLVSEETPRSSTYAWGLSDGAPRHARVLARQIYAATIAFSEVQAAYEDRFRQWGWVALPLSSEAPSIKSAFRLPDDENMIVGLCLAPDSDQYMVFINFDETWGCEGQNTRLGCVAWRSCDYD